MARLVSTVDNIWGYVNNVHTLLVNPCTLDWGGFLGGARRTQMMLVVAHGNW